MMAFLGSWWAKFSKRLRIYLMMIIRGHPEMSSSF
jgi:hypothetical protein